MQVHVVEMMPEVLGAMDKETSGMLRSEYQKRGVTFHLNAKVIEVGKEGVTIEKEGKTALIEAEKVLVSVGRKANLSQVGLDKLNIELLRNGVKVDEHMQTSHPRVYACGDITGRSMLAHTAIRESEVAVNHILGVEDRMNYDCVPGVVYTNPEVAGVGKTEEELKASGISYHVQKLPMAYSGRFVAENELVNGLCKLILDDDDRVIGCHMLGNPVSELIVLAGLAGNVLSAGGLHGPAAGHGRDGERVLGVITNDLAVGDGHVHLVALLVQGGQGAVHDQAALFIDDQVLTGPVLLCLGDLFPGPGRRLCREYRHRQQGNQHDQ